MKREGRQHGMVRTYMILPSALNPRPKTKVINQIESPPTAGLYTKVSSKPTNHSKFTGKCGRPKCVGCHIHPACKSKDKAKGTQKSRSNDVTNKLISWRVVDKGRGGNYAGISATAMLGYLSNDYEENSEIEDCVDDNSPPLLEEIGFGGVEIDDDGDDDHMSFCDVGFVVEQVDGDEGWCLVGEL